MTWFSPAVPLVVNNEGQRGPRCRAVLPMISKIGCKDRLQRSAVHLKP